MPKNIEDLIAPNAIPYQGVAFNPLEYKPFTPDVNILQRSLAQIEERNEKASTHKAALKKALGEARLKVHQDEESLKWFDQFAQQLEEPILVASERGDAAAAIEAAQQSAGDLTNSPAFLGRIQTNLQYQEQQKTNKEKVNKGINTPDEYEYWEDTNPYYNKDIYNENGKIVGVEEWKEQNPLLPHLNLFDFYGKVANAINVDKNAASGDSSEILEDGHIRTINRSGYTQKLTEQDIETAIEKVLEDNPQFYDQMLQDRNVGIWYVTKYGDSNDPSVQAKIRKIKEYTFRNDVPLSVESYMKGEKNSKGVVVRKGIVQRYAKEFAYNHNMVSENENIHGGKGSGSGDDDHVSIDINLNTGNGVLGDGSNQGGTAGSGQGGR